MFRAEAVKQYLSRRSAEELERIDERTRKSHKEKAVLFIQGENQDRGRSLRLRLGMLNGFYVRMEIAEQLDRKVGFVK